MNETLLKLKGGDKMQEYKAETLLLLMSFVRKVERKNTLPSSVFNFIQKHEKELYDNEESDLLTDKCRLYLKHYAVLKN